MKDIIYFLPQEACMTEMLIFYNLFSLQKHYALNLYSC